jgi:hypothetical protein
VIFSSQVELATVSAYTGTGSPLALSDAQALRCMVLKLTGTHPGGAYEVHCPTNRKIYVVWNSTAGEVTFKPVAGTGVPVNAGAVLILYCDGTDVSSITTEQFFDQVPTLNPRETAHLQVSVDFPVSPTDHAIVTVYTTLDDSSEVWDLIPMMEFLLENAADPNRISFLVTGVYKFRVGVRRSGSTDTIASADLSLRKDGVNA